MSYPPIRYHGADGERTATLRRAGDPPDLVYPTGTTVDYLATGASTGGLFGLYRWSMPGTRRTRAALPPDDDREVLRARRRITIFDGHGWRECEPGDFVHVPIGGIHGFRNDSGAFASMLIHFSPGAPREGYFEGNARFAAEGKPAEDVMAAFYAEHDNVWLEEG